ncbi:DUF6519 domain-containing protein [Aurantivibrio plasticivorans]
MKTQISRNSFDAQKRYSGVYQQMGRMLTDADWNEFSDLAKNRLAEAITDIIGSGTPRDRGIVAVNENPDGSESYTLQWGYAYVDGIQAQVRPYPQATLADATGVALEYEHQDDFPLAPVPSGSHRLYLDVWERTILSLEDADLLDAGLHGADTCTRTQTMAQVKWCEVDVNPEDPDVNPPIGNALLTLEVRQGSTEPDPCDPCADEIALQDDIGNYLFRFEAHDVIYDSDGNPERITLKWSSENAGEQYGIGELPLGFASSNWAYEFFDGEADRYATEKHLGKHLATGFTPERGTLTKGYPDAEPTGFELVRRWDGFCTLEKNGTTWNLVSDSGFDRGADMASTSSADAHGHVSEGTSVTLNLNALTAILDIADWQMLAGDYWQADVRQAIHVAGSILLADELPHGILHHYLALGTVSDGEFTPYDAPECKRFNFPPLTDIKASDVCYDNGACEMPNVNTVQDALDHLCQERDLRWHNKHLHGWGIVCGLVAECCPNHSDNASSEGAGTSDENEASDNGFDSRRSVCVTPGYALTCEGEDIVLDSQQQVDVLAQILALEESGQTVLTNGNGTVCLRVDIGANGKPALTIETYDSSRHKNNLFDGTLLMDFFQHCIMDLVTAVQNEFRFLNAEEIEEIEGGATGLVSVQRRKFTSIINLLIQVFNADNGGYVFLSLKEHNILKDFYLQLQELLRSKTFCAMFEGDEFPEYPFRETGMTTIFGKNFHTRVQLHPNGRYLYSYNGVDNTINIYELEKRELVKVLEMPSAEGAQISSLAISPSGDLLYAAASVRGVDTVFGVARIEDDYRWEEMTILCDITLSEMVVSPTDEGLIYGIGIGKGLFYLRPQLLFADVKPQPAPTYSFNAVGHLKLDFNEGNAYCTASGSDTGSDYYDRIVQCDLRGTGENLPVTTSLMLQGFTGESLIGRDGIEINPARVAEDKRVYVIVEANDNQKYLATFSRPFENGAGKLQNMVAIENTQVCLAFHEDRNQLALGLEDGYRLQLFEYNGSSSNFFRTPVQIQPTDMVVNRETGETYVLNYVSNTISLIPSEELSVPPEFLERLANYRMAILMAFYSLVGNILQYLKDCFCHHLLVKCPSCDDDNVIYLATVEIRENEVYKICNFDKRKYVKSFPTVDYWMSLVPIMPLIKTAVSKVCCSIIPNIFDKYADTVVRSPKQSAGQNAAGNNSVKAQQARQVMQVVQTTDTKAIWRNQSNSINLVTQLGGDRVSNFIDVNRTNQAGVGKQALLQADVDQAVVELEKNNITVSSVEEYDPNKANVYLAEYNKAPPRIDPGSEVILIKKGDRVMYYAPKQTTNSATSVDFTSVEISETLKGELVALEQRKTALSDMTHLEAELAQAEARRNSLSETESLKAELADLQSQKASMEAELAGIKSEFSSIQNTRTQEEAMLTQIKAEREALAADLSGLSKNLKDMDAMRKELAVEVNKTRPVADLAEVDTQTDALLKEAGIRTIDELAKASESSLALNSDADVQKMKLAIDAAKNKLSLLP